MIKLPDGELLDLLPSQMKSDTNMICLSYALKCAMKKVLAYERGAMTSNFIDSIPEKILDVLAVELRSPYYLDSMDIEVKRKIVKNTLIWHTKAGTVSAVQEVISTVLGEGRVEEWYEYGAPPYWFKIITGVTITEEMFASFSEMIQGVKNVRSHIEAIEVPRTLEGIFYSGAGLCQHYRPAAIIEGFNVSRVSEQTIYYFAVHNNRFKNTITQSKEE